MKTKRRHKKRCKYYIQHKDKTGLCMFLGNDLFCYKSCNMYVEKSKTN